MYTEDSVLSEVERQLREWMPVKYGWKRTPNKVLMRLHKLFLHLIFGRKTWVSKGANLELGVDEFGRSIFDGIQRYVEIIKSRGVKVHTVLVLGSRAKGRWNPTSDVDVTVIASNLPVNRHRVWPIKKIVELKQSFTLSDFPTSIGVEPSECCDKKEFLRRLEKFDIHALDAVYYGKVIYDDGFWEEVKKKVELLEKKYNLPVTELKNRLLPL
jgi:predicted nucleotidyltransferase